MPQNNCSENSPSCGGSSCGSRGLEADRVSQPFQAMDEAALYCLALALVEVVCTKFLVGDFVSKQMISDHQNRMSDSNDGLLLPTTGGEPMILRRQVAVGVTGGLCHLHQG